MLFDTLGIGSWSSFRGNLTNQTGGYLKTGDFNQIDSFNHFKRLLDAYEAKNTFCFMLTVAEAIKEAMDEIVSLCPICSKPHTIEFLKPTVCKNELCQFQYVIILFWYIVSKSIHVFSIGLIENRFSSLGLGMSIEHEIIHCPG